MDLSLSSKDFYRAWRYAVETDFTKSNGQPFDYADDGKQSWGDELKTLRFHSSPSAVAIDDSRTLLAVAVDHDIHLYNGEFEPILSLRGHTSQIKALTFQPGEPNVLVSFSSEEDPDVTPPVEPTILLWNLKNAPGDGLQRSLHGRLAHAFQSEVFSPSGKFMMYMPGNRPESNGDDQWDIKIVSLREQEHVLTLSGHRDYITWTGYDTSENLIGTAAWDKTFRIWDAETGQERYRFRTSHQNWTAGFSPDSTLFAGTSGDGILHIYSLGDGSKLFERNLESNWCRALDWTPDSTILAVGGEFKGKLSLVDVEKKEVVQRRVLSTARMSEDNEILRGLADRVLVVRNVRFADRGRKLIFWTGGDGSAEAYDLGAGKKWRFAREGTQSYEDSEKNDEVQERKVNRLGGMKIWEDFVRKQIMVATIDKDAVRIWSLEIESEDESVASAF